MHRPGDTGAVDLTETSFRALARSSPWRWRTLHLRHRGARGVVEAWVERPDRMLVRTPDGDHVVTDELRGPSFVTVGGPSPAPVAPRWAFDVPPTLRPDGLVDARPDELVEDFVARHSIVYGDLMWQSYDWVAMLDPLELSHHTVVSALRAGTREGRPTWWARVAAVDGYEPRCGCCPLLWSAVSERDEAAAGGVTWADQHPGVTYPEAYDVALDVQTGIVVSLRPVGGDRPDAGFDVDVLEIDA